MGNAVTIPPSYGWPMVLLCKHTSPTSQPLFPLTSLVVVTNADLGQPLRVKEGVTVHHRIVR